jgi:peptide-methionine (S)-S-oxide reductase
MKKIATLGAVIIGVTLLAYLAGPGILKGQNPGDKAEMSTNTANDQNISTEGQSSAAMTGDTGGKDRAQMMKATFGAGCFWGVEAAYRQIEGVVSTQVGFMGGTVNDPSYKDVCYKNTGHAEVVEVTYDPSRVSYEKLLDVFWENHDPTQLNRQGPDVGDQYRSAIFFHSPEQEKLALASKKILEESGKYKKPIVTEITPATDFWRAEEYHQQYLEKRGLSTCRIK